MLRASSSSSWSTTRRSPLAWVLVGVLVLPFVGCVFGRAGVEAEKDGRAVYAEACASCHGRGGKGDGPVAKSLRNPPADLTRLSVSHGNTFPHDEVKDVITGERTIAPHGEREMPVWNQRFSPSGSGATVGATIYTRRHLEQILRYLESIQRSD